MLEGFLHFKPNLSLNYRSHSHNNQSLLCLLPLLLSLLQLYLMTNKSEILKMDKAIEKERSRLKELEKFLEREKLRFEEVLRENEKKSVEARTL